MYSLKIGSGQCLLSQCPHYWRIKIQGDSCAPKIDLIEHRTLRSLFDPCLGGSPLQDCERERERAGGVAWAPLGRTLLLCRRSRLHGGGNVHQQHLTGASLTRGCLLELWRAAAHCTRVRDSVARRDALALPNTSRLRRLHTLTLTDSTDRFCRKKKIRTNL